MKAILFPGGGTVDVVDRPTPAPGQGEVLVRVRSSALCRSDMSLYNGTPIVGGAGAGLGTIIPGHESAGEIAAVGAGVDGLREGDRVAISLAVGCGRCRWCLRGYRFLCPTWQCLGFDLDGGDAEYQLIPAANALPIPDAMSFDAAAVSTDMMGTQWSAQKRLGVTGADTVAVFGIGPMGCAGVLVAKALGARVIATAGGEEKLEIARRAGADAAFDYRTDSWVEKVKEATGGHGADVIYDPVGGDVTDQSLRCIAWNGRHLVIGFASGRIPEVKLNRVLLKNISIVGLHWGAHAIHEPARIPETFARLFELHSSGRIAPEIFPQRFGLDELPEALAALGSRRTWGKVVVAPNPGA